ncbi:hypothetical protein RIF29_11094 [Crotalaria pallida]|uniref:Uncharacterized protein n=1 Tax=Crotalaria pallida TaxID=3830 RepID=A0AAN9ILU0_CROPI
MITRSMSSISNGSRSDCKGYKQRIQKEERTRGLFNPDTSFTFSDSFNQNPLSKARERKTCMKKDSIITESDIEAAQQLIQLSVKDNINVVTLKRNRRCEEDEYVDNDIALGEKIQEIFGEYEVSGPKKKRKRYRSLANIYKETKPINQCFKLRLQSQLRCKCDPCSCNCDYDAVVKILESAISRSQLGTFI